MSEYIKRENAIKAAKHAWAKGLEPSQYIEIIPPADVAPVVHSKWIKQKCQGDYGLCSKCSCRIPWIPKNYKYCPNCNKKCPTVTQPNEWISLEDKLPEKGGQYMACCDDEGVPIGEGIWYQKDVVVCAEYYGGEWTWYDGNTEYDLTGIVTHWMPLPEPPYKED